MSGDIIVLPGQAVTVAPALDDDPAKQIRAGLIVVLLFFGVFLGWAAFARLDAAALGEGAVSVAGHRQAVQHREGGVVAKLNVKEGQRVKAGQVLVELAGADVLAQERALASSTIGLQAQRARLEAEIGGGAIRWPAEFARYTGDDRVIADHAMRLQTQHKNARGSSLGSANGVIRQRKAEISAQISGFGAQSAATRRQRDLLEQQLKSTRELAGEGYASINTVRQIERTIASLDGADADFAARSAAAREQIGELAQQSGQQSRKYTEDSSTELRDTLFQLNELLPKWQAAREQLARTRIRAPASGRVVGLSIFTVGGVIGAGEKLMDIVPDRAPLIVQASFAPTNFDGVAEGQEAQVKFLSFHERDLPLLLGTIRNVSADSLLDEKSGQRYYTAEITVPPDQLDILKRVRGGDAGLKPGVPVQIQVPLRKRTALQYLFEPLTEAFSRAFRER